MTVERWLPIAGYEGRYDVSDFGRVRSLRNQRNNLRATPKFLSLKPEGGSAGTAGYVKVALTSGPGTKPKTYWVHSLVLNAFAGAPPEAQEGCHNDGGRSNNRLDNLRWDTHAGNLADMARHGTLMRGVAHYNAVLTIEDVWAIRAEPQFLGVNEMLARCWGVRSRHIGKIRRNEIWNFPEAYPLEQRHMA